jgi:uncharacterized membrane protein
LAVVVLEVGAVAVVTMLLAAVVLLVLLVVVVFHYCSNSFWFLKKFTHTRARAHNINRRINKKFTKNIT